MRVTKPMVVTFYAIIGLTGFVLAALRISSGLYLNAVLGTAIAGFCAYRLFVTLRSG